MKRILSILIILAASASLYAQQPTQTVRGTVVDKVTQSPLPYVIVVVAGTDPATATNVDMNGSFRLTGIPVGKHTLKFILMGYKELVMPNIIVNSGKETVLNISMEEDIIASDVVEVTAKTDKSQSQNDMATVSARTFSVEETQKYAAAVNDPGRMATSFAGVVASGGDGNNRISIRGNAPNGLLWRLEGVDIPNPNHFSQAGTSGGGISILSSQLLSNSDFFIGAFPSEYGNALSGVFDLRLRKGNNEKREHTLQAGFLGIDVSSEGPFSKGYGGSYLFNYRYSTLSLIGKLGVPLGDAVTVFQDFSFNVSLPTQKAGHFTVFGFGGLSSETHLAKTDSSKWETNWDRVKGKFFANTGAAGITHSRMLGSKAYLKTVLLASATGNGYKEEYLEDSFRYRATYKENYIQPRFTASSTLNYKHNAKHSLRAGIIAKQLGYDLEKSIYNDELDTLEQFLKSNGTTYTLQGFAQWNARFTEKLTVNYGLHSASLLLNNTHSIEPRAGIRYELNKQHVLSAGYGLHSQVQPLGIYFAQTKQLDNAYIQPNRDLGMSKSHHFVLGYDHLLNEYHRIKIETYYQSLFDIPVGADSASTLSAVNVDGDLITERLVETGKGRNYGVELTAERFLYKDLYYLLSVSLFDSKYKANDNVWRSTKYNGSYAMSFTGGKEIKLGEKWKHRVLGFNVKSQLTGGQRRTPVDVAASIEKGYTVTKDELAFTEKNAAYFRTDIRVSLQTNRKRSTSTLALDIQNVTNRKNIGGTYFNSEKAAVETWYQAPLIPVLSYKIEF